VCVDGWMACSSGHLFRQSKSATRRTPATTSKSIIVYAPRGNQSIHSLLTEPQALLFVSQWSISPKCSPKLADDSAAAVAAGEEEDALE
jgi:hypothetical protein